MAIKRRIVMIYPEIPATYWNFKHILKIVGKRAAFPPLGLMTVASIIPGNYDVRLVDMNTTPLRESDILDADLVFISAMIIQKKSFERVVAQCNRLGRIVVAGGPYPTGSYSAIDGVDHFILGEAEATLPIFLDDYERGVPRRVYAGTERPDMEASPIPRFDLVRYWHYTTMSLQYSRGCPFNCEFCDIIEMFGRVPRTKSPSQFVAEMEALHRTGYRGSLFIVDDNFIGNKRNVKQLLPAVTAWQKQNDYPFSILTEASINLAADDNLMKMMVEAGFNKVFLGIETPVEESLAQARKEQNTGIGLLECVEKIQRAGLEVSAGFILGFDSDPENVFDLQIDFIRRSAIPMAMVGLLTALPNTQLYRRMVRENRLISETSGNNTHDLQLNFIPVMDQAVLVRGYRKVLAEIYKPAAYFRRCLDLMRVTPKGRLGRGAVSLSTTLMVIRSFFLALARQTFSSYGARYLAYLSRVIRNKPVFLPRAFKLALQGHHLFMITREIVAVDDFSNYLEKASRLVRERIERIRSARLDDVLHDILSRENSFFIRGLVWKVKRQYFRLHGDSRPSLEEPIRHLIDEIKVYLEMTVQVMKKRLESGMACGLGSHEVRRQCVEIKYRFKKKYRYLRRYFRAHFDMLTDYFEGRIDRIMREIENGNRLTGN